MHAKIKRICKKCGKGKPVKGNFFTYGEICFACLPARNETAETTGEPCLVTAECRRYAEKKCTGIGARRKFPYRCKYPKCFIQFSEGCIYCGVTAREMIAVRVGKMRFCSDKCLCRFVRGNWDD